MELDDRVELIADRKDLSEFVVKLRDDLLLAAQDWEIPDLARFLDALAA